MPEIEVRALLRQFENGNIEIPLPGICVPIDSSDPDTQVKLLAMLENLTAKEGHVSLSCDP